MGPGYIERLEATTSRGNYKSIAAIGKPPSGEARLLDVGCAAGFALLAARKRGWSVHGVELSQSLAEIARTRYGLHVESGSLEEVRQRLGRLGPFDCITMFDLIEHLGDIRSFLRSYLQYLRKGGVLFIDTPNWSRSADNDASKLALNKQQHLTSILEHLSYLAINDIEWLARELPLRIVDWGSYGTWGPSNGAVRRWRTNTRQMLERLPLFSRCYWKYREEALAEGEYLDYHCEERPHLFVRLQKTE